MELGVASVIMGTVKESLAPLPPPRLPADPAWDEAFLRVESYLRAHRVESRILLNRLTVEVIAAARDRVAEQPELAPLAAAMGEADARLGAWFTQLLDEPAGKRTRIGPRGRLALVLAQVPRRWPQHFLDTTGAPEEMVAAMRASYLEVGPELQFTNMAPQPIDLGPLANAAGDTWETLRRRPWLRLAAGVVVAVVVAWWWWMEVGS